MQCLQIRSLLSRCHKIFCCCTTHYPKRRAIVVDCIEELQQLPPSPATRLCVTINMRSCQTYNTVATVTVWFHLPEGVRSVTLTI